MNLIKKILENELFIKHPPVLIDIGASGFINKKWKSLAKYSICIAFDADDRDMQYIKTDKSDWKNLIIVNKIVTNEVKKQKKFYLTKSPHCSSFLKPNMESLNNWAFTELFDMERVTRLDTTDIPTILDEYSINYVDWFNQQG